MSFKTFDVKIPFHNHTKLYQHFFKYMFDMLGALCLLILLSPLFLVIAIAIRLETKGPIFFRQNRVGYKGHIFRIFKFRSMTVLDNGNTIKQATKNDARVTKVGRFLRASSLDELPQLINVLLGDMSLVGPRPHAVAHDEAFAQEHPAYKLRYNVLPGITGYAQIKGFRGELDHPSKLQGRIKYDVKYTRKISFLKDMSILIRTALVVFFQKNAY